jgi:hypothetical protein
MADVTESIIPAVRPATMRKANRESRMVLA